MGKQSELVDVQLAFKFFPKSGVSAAFGRYEDSTEPIFLPLAQIEMEPRNPDRNQTVEVTLPRWLAEKQGLV